MYNITNQFRISRAGHSMKPFYYNRYYLIFIKLWKEVKFRLPD